MKIQQNTSVIFLYHHLGLGDHFVCNGLIRHFMKKFNATRLYLPTKKKNLSTVQKIYSDDSRILCLPVHTDYDVPNLIELMLNPTIIQVGFAKCRDDWDVSFYDSVDTPFSVRWSEFKINRDYDREKNIKTLLGLNDEPYIVVHDVGSIGKFDISLPNDKRIVRIENITDCLLDWCGIIENADEVHCVDSSVIHLAQTLNVKRGVYHNIRTKSTLFCLKDGWETVKYE